MTCEDKTPLYLKKSEFLKNTNVINYDTGKYLTYYKSTLNNNEYIQDVSFLTNFSTTKDLDNYFKDLGLISSSVGQTYADVNDLIKDFNFKPSTTLKEGLSNFAKWYKQYYCK